MKNTIIIHEDHPNGAVPQPCGYFRNLETLLVTVGRIAAESPGTDVCIVRRCVRSDGSAHYILGLWDRANSLQWRDIENEKAIGFLAYAGRIDQLPISRLTREETRTVMELCGS